MNSVFVPVGWNDPDHQTSWANNAAPELPCLPSQASASKQYTQLIVRNGVTRRTSWLVLNGYTPTIMGVTVVG